MNAGARTGDRGSGGQNDVAVSISPGSSRSRVRLHTSRKADELLGPASPHTGIPRSKAWTRAAHVFPDHHAERWYQGDLGQYPPVTSTSQSEAPTALANLLYYTKVLASS